MGATVVLGERGRLVIPAGVRAELGLVAEDELALRVSGRRLVLERRGDAAMQKTGTRWHVDNEAVPRRSGRRARRRGT